MFGAVILVYAMLFVLFVRCAAPAIAEFLRRTVPGVNRPGAAFAIPCWSMFAAIPTALCDTKTRLQAPVNGPVSTAGCHVRQASSRRLGLALFGYASVALVVGNPGRATSSIRWPSHRVAVLEMAGFSPQGIRSLDRLLVVR